MQNTKNIKYFIFFGVFLIIFLILLLFLIRGNEDDWLCQNGEWVRHGNPKTEKPVEQCAGTKEINSFEECASAGKAIMESYPRQCAANGKTFVENIGNELEKIKVKVYFNNNKFDPEVSCNKVFAVEREVIKTPAIARAALTELLAGTTETEAGAGFTTSLNPNIKIQSLTILNGVAKVDFDKQLEAGIGGSCRVAAISAQIRETLKQFPSVQSVIISIDGRSEDILQP